MDVNELTRPEIEALIPALNVDERWHINARNALIQLLRQLDAANAKIALHERENVTRGMLIDQLEARADAAPPDVAQAARVLMENDAALTELAIEIMRNNKLDATGNRPGYRPALIAALRSIAGETP